MRSASSDQPLAGRKVLVVEDEYMIADDLSALLHSVGAEVIGPAASLPKAMRLVDRSSTPDAALLDINLRGEMVFPLGEKLRERDVPMMFLTGYGCDAVPKEFSAVPRCEKPLGLNKLVETLVEILD